MPEKRVKTTMSVREMREMLGLGKTESYWLVHKNYFETILVYGKMRIVVESFEKWYANQVKYKKVNGPAPGAELRQMSYSPQEIAKMLDITDSSVYYLIKRDHIPTFKVDSWIRIRKQDFEKWYVQQEKHRTKKDRASDRVREEISLSMPEAARELGIPRNEVYKIFKAKANRGKFEYLKVRNQWRITRESFDNWYESQSEYVKPEDRPEYIAAEMERQNKEREARQASLFREKSVYTVEEAALLLDKSYYSVYRMIQSGKIAARKIGNSYRVPKEEILRFIEDKNKTRHGRGTN